MVRSACVVIFAVLLLLSPTVLADIEVLLRMARATEPQALHAALHNYQGKRKFQHGVFEQDLKAVEAIHIEEAADAVRIVELAKRQSIPRNSTVVIVSPTTDRPQIISITTSAELSPTDTTEKSTGTPEPPPSDTTTTTSTEAAKETTSTSTTSEANHTSPDSKPKTTDTTTTVPTTTAPYPTTIRSTSFYTSRRTTFITDKNGQTSTSVEVLVVTPTATYIPSYPTGTNTSTKSSGGASLQNAANNNTAQFHLIFFTIIATGLVGILL